MGVIFREPQSIYIPQFSRNSRMVVKQGRPKRTITGARYIAFRKFRKSELGRTPALTHIGMTKVRLIRTRGADLKVRLIRAEFANLLEQKSKTFQKAKIVSVIDNPASRNFTRRNIITKGTVIETEKGRAKVTSRPGQDGMVNAVLIS